MWDYSIQFAHHENCLWCKLCVCVKSFQSCPTLPHYGLLPARLLSPWDSPGKNTGVACHALLQGIFPTQGWNLYLLQLRHGRWILYCWAHREAHNVIKIYIKWVKASSWICKITKMQEVTNGNKSCKAFLKKKRKLKCFLLQSLFQ